MMMEGEEVEKGTSSVVVVVQWWRTAFLSLRDETATISSSISTTPTLLITSLINHLIFNNNTTSISLIAAAELLSCDELISDLIFLLQLAAAAHHDDTTSLTIAHTFTQLFQFIYDVRNRLSLLHINSSDWIHMLGSFEKMVTFLGTSCVKKAFSVDAVLKAVKQALEIVSVHHGNGSLLETTELLKFLLSTSSCLRDASSSVHQRYTAELRKSISSHSGIWEVRSTVYTLISKLYLRAGSSLSVEIWQSTIDVMKKDMDILASSSMPVQDSVVARFYTSLLNCLHLVLVDPKGPLSNHVAGFVAALRMFFIYGISDKSQLLDPSAGYQKTSWSAAPNLSMGGSSNSDSGRYRPPHLRKQVSSGLQQLKSAGSSSFRDQESCGTSYTSSDSDYSDNDGPTIDALKIHCRKARVAAIVCIQDLCLVDPKLFTAQWTMLLPSSDVLQPRKYEATLMTCLLFDPYLKARITSASTLLAMLDGPASVFLQVAEHKDSVRRGSFTSLSSSVGQILVQLHTGILFLIQHETHGGLLPLVFRILKLLISSTPYSRMSGDLLPTVISSLQAKIREGFPQRSDQSSLLAVVINCLTDAISSSPSSPKVRDLFGQEINQGIFKAKGEKGVLSSIFQYSESVNSPTLCLEALKTLQAVSHNYPDMMGFCWPHVSSTVHGFFSIDSSVPTLSWKGNGGSIGEKVIAAAVKVLDECLRAISGFKGTEDCFDDKSFDTPFTSDYTRTKKISSAPSFGSTSIEVTKTVSKSCTLGTVEWCQALEKHLPLVLSHTSSMVRAASVTCFAGLTSSVFSSLSKEKQDFILSSTINAALSDEVPSIRSAACRAIGVITCFPVISQSAVMLEKFIHAIEFNTHDSLVLVRIAASWALANICDSLRHFIDFSTSETCSTDINESYQLIAVLLESAMRMTKDNDKIKANAVRALGNLSRFVKFASRSGLCSETVDSKGFSAMSRSSKDFLARNDGQGIHNKKNPLFFFRPALLEDSCWVGKMVQSFLSCVATGNVKVQWNVCRALSNLFMNETLKLRDMDWAPSVFSILLLLLRDSPNYKIRIQAAAALAVPVTIVDYGDSFLDVLQSVEHTVENLSSEQILPSSFKYRIALEKQVTSTLLHVIGVASSADQQPVTDFLVKKASFLEEWFKVLLSPFLETDTQACSETKYPEAQKKHIISKAIMSLIQVYKSRKLATIAEKFEKVFSSMG